MWDIDQTIKDNSKRSGKSSLYLNSNKPLNPYHISYPIEWTGFLNGKSIKIIQMKESSSRTADYDFSELALEDSVLKGDIAKYIDTKLKRCLD